jgi:hypothetical protein
MAIVDSKLPFYLLDPSQDRPGGCSRGKQCCASGGISVDGFSWNPLSAGAASPGYQLLCVGNARLPPPPAGACSA